MATETPVGAFNKVLASSLQGIAPKLGLQVYDSFPLFDAIVKNGNKKPWSGDAIRQPIIGKKYKDAVNYTDYDEIANIAQEPFTVADFEMAGVAQSVTLAGMQMRKNRTAPKKLIDLLATETKMAFLSMKEKLTSNLFASSNTSKGVLSLNTITDATTTIGGVAGSSAWGGTTTASGSFALQGLSDCMTMKQTLSLYSTLDGAGAEGIDMLMTTPAVYRYMWAALQSGQRYAGNSADPYLNLSFDGVKVKYDNACTSGVMFFLNTNHMWMYVASDADFSVQEEIKPIDQDAFSKLILWNGQIVVDARRFFGKLTSITA